MLLNCINKHPINFSVTEKPDKRVALESTEMIVEILKVITEIYVYISQLTGINVSMTILNHRIISNFKEYKFRLRGI